MALPYTVDVRPDTGLTSPKLGIWLFLASEVMLFGSLFSAYAILRSGAETWPDQSSVLSVPLALVNTALLVLLSVAIRRAWRALGVGAFSRYRILMGLTILCGVAFMGVKTTEYADKLAQGLVPATSNFLALYYTMTGLHALHVLAGLAVNLYLWGPGARMWRDEPQRFTNRVEIAGIYWHFVDTIWILLVIVLYLL